MGSPRLAEREKKQRIAAGIAKVHRARYDAARGWAWTDDKDAVLTVGWHEGLPTQAIADQIAARFAITVASSQVRHRAGVLNLPRRIPRGPTWTPDQAARLIELRKRGTPVAQCATTLGVRESLILAMLAALSLPSLVSARNFVRPPPPTPPERALHRTMTGLPHGNGPQDPAPLPTVNPSHPNLPLVPWAKLGRGQCQFILGKDARGKPLACGAPVERAGAVLCVQCAGRVFVRGRTDAK